MTKGQSKKRARRKRMLDAHYDRVAALVLLIGTPSSYVPTSGSIFKYNVRGEEAVRQVWAGRSGRPKFSLVWYSKAYMAMCQRFKIEPENPFE
jgi:hypothetical protein